MKKHLVIVDYGSGNLRSVHQALLAATKQAQTGNQWHISISHLADDLHQADKIILPGQGHMQDCMKQLADSSLQSALLYALKNKPLFGICVGMQMLLSSSDEGPCEGLNWLLGHVKRFELQKGFKIPQMGWNRVYQTPHPLWQGIDDGAYFYFVHSYYAQLAEKTSISGETNYICRFTSALAHQNVFATQFHPEKSAHQGLKLFANFLDWNP